MRKLALFLLLFFGGLPVSAQVSQHPTRIITLRVNDVVIRVAEGGRITGNLATLTPVVTDDDFTDDVKVTVKRGDQTSTVSLSFTSPEASALGFTIRLLDVDVRANLPVTGLGYGDALKAIDSHHSIRRIAWNNCLLVIDVGNTWRYQVTEADRIANDWLVVEE